MKLFFVSFIALLFFQNYGTPYATFEKNIASRQGSVKPKNKTAQALINAGFVNVKDIDCNIVVDLKYATTNNFTGIVLYHNLTEAYLHVDAAKKLGLAQKKLRNKHPEYNLIVYDAARPCSAQQIMWNIVKGTKYRQYVSSPKSVSTHSYGIAVDLSIVDKNGVALDMGTAFDAFEKLSQPKYEIFFLKSGQLTQKQLNNRLLLRYVMTQAGFLAISNEWWHFETMRKAHAKNKYKPIN